MFQPQLNLPAQVIKILNFLIKLLPIVITPTFTIGIN